MSPPPPCSPSALLPFRMPPTSCLLLLHLSGQEARSPAVPRLSLWAWPWHVPLGSAFWVPGPTVLPPPTITPSLRPHQGRVLEGLSPCKGCTLSLSPAFSCKPDPRHPAKGAPLGQSRGEHCARREPHGSVRDTQSGTGPVPLSRTAPAPARRVSRRPGSAGPSPAPAVTPRCHPQPVSRLHC